ncbi:MAG: hypothetical protein V2A67_11015 [Bacteroidota bacterium]
MPLFKIDKPKKFTYIPRFYDARKEELNNRIEDIKQETEQGENPDQYVSHIKGRMRARHDALYGPTGKAKKGLIGRRLVTLIYVGLVLVIIYYIIRMLAFAD